MQVYKKTMTFKGNGKWQMVTAYNRIG